MDAHTVYAGETESQPPLRHAKHFANQAVDVLYGTPERTSRTLVLCFAALIAGGLLMQSSVVAQQYCMEQSITTSTAIE